MKLKEYKYNIYIWLITIFLILISIICLEEL